MSNTFSLRGDILTVKPRKISIFLSSWQPLVVCGPWWVKGVLESKRLDSKLLQSGLMREERRPATGRNVGGFRNLVALHKMVTFLVQLVLK